MSRPRNPPKPPHVPVPMDKRLRPTKYGCTLTSAKDRANHVLIAKLNALRGVVA